MFYNRQTILKTASMTAMMAVLSTNVTANAAVLNPGLKTTVGAVQSNSVSFSELTPKLSDPILDWRAPSHTIEFDLADSDWTSGLSLILSADPMGRVNPTTPFFVRLNSGDPIRINTKGKGFDARIKLKTSELRETKNKLTIYLGAPKNASCFLPKDGEWSINLQGSSLKLRTRAKSQNYVINDLKERFNNTIIAPSAIGLIAKGPNATKHQALMAQSIGLRMETMPRFTTLNYTGEVDFVIGRRDAIKNNIRNKNVLQKSGPKIVVDTGRPLRVIVTGDTDAEVDRAVSAFAQFELPTSDADYIDAGFFSLQPRLQPTDKLIHKSKTRLSDLGRIDFEKSWKPGTSQLVFDVKNSQSARGEILLRLNTPSSLIEAKSDLTLSLNGTPLGKTNLDKKRKSVSFDIPKGLLQGQNNTLKLEPLAKYENVENCSQIAYEDNALYLGLGSSLKIDKSNETPISDVSNLMTTGAPFSDLNGEDTLLVLPKSAENYHIALDMLARLAQTSGKSWANAVIIRDVDSVSAKAQNKNLLFIMPSNELPPRLKNSAPKTLKLALNGRASQGVNLTAKEIQQYASNELIESIRDTPRASSNNQSVNSGGVAALYESPFDKDKVVAVITNTPKQSFKSTMAFLKKQDHWNAIEGSVARWNKNSVLMTELSSDLPNFVRSTPDLSFSDTVKYRFDKLKTVTSDFLEFNSPEIDFPKINMPDLNLPEINWPRFNFKNLAMPDINFDFIKEKIGQYEINNEPQSYGTNREELISTPNEEKKLVLRRSDLSAVKSNTDSSEKFASSSFLDNALTQNTKRKATSLDLKGLSRVTDKGVIIESSTSRVPNKMGTTLSEIVKANWNSLKLSLTNWSNSLLAKSKNETIHEKYKGKDQTFSLLTLLVVLSLGGILIAIGFSAKQPKKQRI